MALRQFCQEGNLKWVGTPDSGLLSQLHLPPVPQERHVVAYAPLPESEILLEALATHLGLSATASYVEVTDRLITEAETFLADVESQAIFRPARRELVSFTRFIG